MQDKKGDNTYNIVLITSFLFIIGALFTGTYFVHLFAAVLVFDFIFFLFWKQDHPPVILLALLMVWLSITVGYFYIAFTGKNIDVLLWRPFYSLDNIDKAYWYSLTGLVFLSVGVKLGAGWVFKEKIEYDLLKRLNTTNLMLFFVVYSPLTDFLFEKLRYAIPGVSQLFFMLKNFKWAIFFLIVVSVFYNRKNLKWFWLLFAYGVILGFASYFSTFKNYFYFLAIGYLTVRYLTGKQVFWLLVAGILVYFIGVYWSYVKGDYRQYLSGGRRAQVVVTSKTDALKKFFSYTKSFDRQRFKYGEEALVKRLFYLEYFSATIRFIPEYKDYMKGANLNRAIRHVTMPRFLFPNKPALDDSKHTMELTGIYVASAKQGTSISTGYMAEFYADYGPFKMNLYIFLLGLFWGWMYKLVIVKSKSVLWGSALTMPMFLFMSGYGKDLTKLVGDTLWYLITVLLIIKFVLPFAERFFEVKQE